MRSFMVVGTSLVLSAVASMASAQTQETCIPKQQVRDATVVLIPYLIDAASKACGPKLDASAFLRSDAATQFSSRLRSERGGREQAAAQAFRTFAHVSGGAKMNDSTVIDSMGERIASLTLDKADANRCDDLSTMLGSMSTLAAQQIGAFVAAVFSLADVKSPRICRG